MAVRSMEEVKARCSSVLANKRATYLVGESSSPTAAYDIVFGEFGDQRLAKAARWLAVLRRDYPEEYSRLIQINQSQVT